eukprot:m.102944 g.102944  ORF g.102944 m.102944 type:complete len:61 (-) comp12558_c0_seq2:2976-3158(-)
MMAGELETQTGFRGSQRMLRLVSLTGLKEEWQVCISIFILTVMRVPRRSYTTESQEGQIS